jgi:hypothetical protein
MADKTNGIVGLSPELIAKLMASGRNRNFYGPKLLEFVESDEAGIAVKEVWPVEMSEKEASTIYQGFNLAAKKANLDETVIVKRLDDQVFLLHKERVAALNG